MASSPSLSQPDPNPLRAQALARIYNLLIRRARGDIVVYYGATLVDGPDGLVGVADLEVDGQRGLVAVREAQE